MKVFCQHCTGVGRGKMCIGWFFLCGISDTLLSCVNFICRREQSVCHVVSTWREDWVPLAKILCGGIPVSVITLMTLLFIRCCFIIIITTLFKSQIILAKHKCSTNWGDCKWNKSKKKSIKSIKSNQIKCWFLRRGKTGVLGEKPHGAE